MKFKPGILRVEWLMALALIVGLASHFGCNAQQADRAAGVADDFGYVFGNDPSPPATTTQPTTQQSAHQVFLDGARAAATTIKYVYPPAAVVFAGIAGLAALFGKAGHSAGKRSTFKQLGGVIGEVADDIAEHKKPGEPWTAATRDVLLQLGRDDVAHVDQFPS
jgi:hypothetical protein